MARINDYGFGDIPYLDIYTVFECGSIPHTELVDNFSIFPNLQVLLEEQIADVVVGYMCKFIHQLCLFLHRMSLLSEKSKKEQNHSTSPMAYITHSV